MVMEVLVLGSGYMVGPDQLMPFPEKKLESLWRTAESCGTYPIRTYLGAVRVPSWKMLGETCIKSDVASGYSELPFRRLEC